MFKTSRIMKIKDLLNEQKFVEVQSLSDKLGVSNVTIRSDLIKLEQEGYLYRTHGGAVLRETALPENKTLEVNLEDVDTTNKKAELGALVERHIIPNTWIYLSYGTTCIEIAKKLLNTHVNVVTGCLDLAQILSKSNTVEVLMPGGYLARGNDYLYLHGEWYQKALENIVVEQAYISIAGIDANGFTVGNALECRTLEKVRDIAKEIIIVADSTKFGKTSFLRLTNMNYADTIITNDDIPDEYRKRFTDLGVKIITPNLK